MAQTKATLVRDYLTRLTGRLETADDDVLLSRYFVQRDADAFAAILHRHGPMVLGVCRRILGCAADAEDAFQSTFLVFSRRGQSIRRGSALPAWLHRVARRVSYRAIAKRRTPSPLVEEPDQAVDERTDPSWREVMGALDEEIDRLPEKLRAPLVLCYLRGVTRDEAAKRLGWSLNTVKRRIERGKDLLKARLSARGASPAAIVGAVLAFEGFKATVSARLAEATIGLATGGPAPPAIASLADGLALTSRWKTVILATVAVVATAGTTMALWPTAAELPPPDPPVAVADPVRDPNPDAPPVDAVVEPLPEGARGRLGTTKFRTGEAHHTFLSPDGLRLWSAGLNRLVASDLTTGETAYTLRATTPSLVNATLGTPPTTCVTADGRSIVTTNFRNLLIYRADTGEKAGETAVEFVDPKTDTKLVPRFVGVWPAGGNRVLAAPTVGAPTIFEAERGTIVRKLPRTMESMCALIDGRYGLVPDGAGVAVLDLETDKVLGPLPGATPAQVRARQWGFAVAPDGKSLAAVQQANGNALAPTPISVYSLPAMTPRLRGNGLAGSVRTLTPPVFSPDGRWLYVTNQGVVQGKIVRLDVRTGEADREYALPAATSDLAYLAKHWLHVTPDGKTLVSNGRDGLIRRWDCESGREMEAVAGAAMHVRGAIAASGTKAAVIDGMGRLEVWDAKERSTRVLRPFGAASLALHWWADDTRLTTLDFDLQCVTWDVATGQQVGGFRVPGFPIPPNALRWGIGVVFSPDGSSVTVSFDAAKGESWLGKYDTMTGVERWRKPLPASQVVPTADGKQLLVQVRPVFLNGKLNGPANLRIYDAANGELVRELPYAAVQPRDQTAPFFPSHDGRHLIAVRIRQIAILDFETGQLRRAIGAKAGYSMEAVTLAPDGRSVAVGCTDGLVQHMDLETLGVVAQRQCHPALIHQIRFSANGQSMLTCSDDLTAIVWDLSAKPRPKPPGR